MAKKSQWEKAKDLYKAEMIQRRDDMLAEYGKTLSEWETMDRLEKYYWIAGMHSAEYFKKMEWNVYDIAFQMSNAGDITLFRSRDIAERLLTPAMFERWKEGKYHYDEIATQARCLSQALIEIVNE